MRRRARKILCAPNTIKEINQEFGNLAQMLFVWGVRIDSNVVTEKRHDSKLTENVYTFCGT